MRGIPTDTDVVAGLIQRCIDVLLSRDIGDRFDGEDLPIPVDSRPGDHHERRLVSEHGLVFELHHTRIDTPSAPQKRRRAIPNDRCALAWPGVTSDEASNLRHILNAGFQAAGFDIYKVVAADSEDIRPENIVFETNVNGLLVRGVTYRFQTAEGCSVTAEVNAKTTKLLAVNREKLEC